MKSWIYLLSLWLKVDFKINSSYRSRWLYLTFQFFITLSLFYFISKTVGDIELIDSSYFVFVSSGLALQSLLSGFSQGTTQKLSEWRDYGMLEELLLSYHSPYKILLTAGSSFYFLSILKTALYLFILEIMVGLHLNVILFAMSVLTTLVLGLLLSLVSSCSFMVWKKFGLLDIFGKISAFFFCGTYFPVEVLPNPLQWVASINPMLYLVQLFRYSLFEEGVSNRPIHFNQFYLVIFLSFGILMALNFQLMKFTLKKIKKSGILSHF